MAAVLPYEGGWRKVRAPPGKALGNAQVADFQESADGKWHRNYTALLVFLSTLDLTLGKRRVEVGLRET